MAPKKPVIKVPSGGSAVISVRPNTQLTPEQLAGAPRVNQPTTQVGGTIINTPTGQNIPVGGSTPYRGGGGSRGGGSSSLPSVNLAQQQAEIAREQAIARIEAEQLAQIEAQKQAEAEKRRIEQLAVEIRRQGAQERQNILMNERGERVRQTITEINKIDRGKSTNALVWKYENLDTGEVRYRSYEGSGRRNIGGVDFTQQSSKQVQEIKNELTEAGLKPIVSNGQVVGFSSPDTKQSYSYTDSGIRAFNVAKERVYSSAGKVKESKVGKYIVDKLDKMKITELYDVLSGGSVTERRILKQQESLNKEIDKFNKIYGSGLLDETTYQKAMQIEKELSNKQNKINQAYDTLATSKRSRVYGFLNPLERRLTLAETQKETDRLVSRQEANLRSMKNELATTTSRYKKTILPKLIKSGEKELERYRAGGRPIVFTGDLPIVPLKALPRGITKVRFLGTQKKLSDGRIVINMAYKTSAGRVGKAQGYVKMVGDKKSIGVIAGRSGVKYFRNANVAKLRKVDTFVGVERSLSSPGAVALKSKMGSGLVATRKAKVINQLSAGRVIMTKGTKASNLFKKGKIDFQDFISLSRALTKRDLSFIAGRTLTSTKAKAKFVGVIKDLDKAGSSVVRLTGGEGRQISQAVQKLVNSMAGSIAVAERTTQGASKITKLAVASNLMRNIASNPQTFTPQVLSSPKLVAQKLIQKVVPMSKTITTQVVSPRQRVKIRQITSVVNAQQNKVKQLTRQLTRTRSKTKQQQIVRQINRVKQQQRSGLRQMQKLKQLQKLQMARPTLRTPTRITPRNIITPFGFRLPNGFSSKTLSRPVQTFYVVEKVRGKFRKLYPKPLVLKDARDYAVYSIDNNLSRTAFFVPLGRAKRVVRPPKNIQNYASRNSFKVRPYRIRFGKRRQLVNGYIEKRRFFQDTSGERNALRVTRKISPQRRRQLIRQLQKARMRRFGNRSPQKNQMRRQVRVRPKRKMSLAQRNVLIARLKRARAVRMRMLRRRR